MVIDDSKPNPSAVRSRLREWEDYNLALRLQDSEFDVHYDHNRTERRTVGNDTRHSKKEQIKEDETAKEMRRAVNRKIEETDEQIAQRLAMEWNSEEQRKVQEKLRQELIDEQLARRLAEAADLGSPVSVYGTQQPTASPASRQVPASDLLIDFSLPTSSGSQYTVQPSYSGSQSSGGAAPRGVPLPGLATTSNPPRPPPPQISSSYNLPPPSQLLQPEPVAESPVNWPPPPPSVFQSAQPTSALPPPIQPTSLPPPSYVPQPLSTAEMQPPALSVHPNSQIGLSSNNPFLADLMTSNPGVGYGSVLPPASSSVVPPPASTLPPSSIGFSVAPPAYSTNNTNIGFRPDFGLPPPSALALGGTSTQPQQPQYHQQYQ